MSDKPGACELCGRQVGSLQLVAVTPWPGDEFAWVCGRCLD